MQPETLCCLRKNLPPIHELALESLQAAMVLPTRAAVDLRRAEGRQCLFTAVIVTSDNNSIMEAHRMRKRRGMEQRHSFGAAGR